MDQNHIRKFVMLVDIFQSFMNRILSPCTTFNQNKTFPFCPRLKNLKVLFGNHQENIPDSRMFLEGFKAVFQKGCDVFSKKFIFTSLFISVSILIQVQQQFVLCRSNSLSPSSSSNDHISCVHLGDSQKRRISNFSM